MLDLVWLIPALPLAGFLVLLAIGRRIGEPGAGWLATAMCGGSFLATLVVYAGLLGEDEHHRSFVQTLFEWMPVGDLQVDIAFLADPLSITMALFVTGVGTLIHLYSIGYMHGDDGFWRFFAYLNLFIFAMLNLVLAENLLVLFLGWEGVGLCSYLLIGFWFKNTEYNNAAKKAFIMNRIGDVGLILGVIMIFMHFGTLSYPEVFAQATEFTAGSSVITWITILLFIGAIGVAATRRVLDVPPIGVLRRT